MSLEANVLLHQTVDFIVLTTGGYEHALGTFENQNVKIHLLDVKATSTVLEDAWMHRCRAVKLLVLDIVVVKQSFILTRAQTSALESKFLNQCFLKAWNLVYFRDSGLALVASNTFSVSLLHMKTN